MFDYDLQRPKYSVWSQLAILLVLSGVGLLVGSIISIPIATAYLHVPIEKLPEALMTTENANLSRLLQIITTFFFMAVPAFIFSRIMNKNAFRFIGFNEAISGKQVFIIVGIVLIGLLVSGALGEVNEMIPLSDAAKKYFKDLENVYNKEMLVIAKMKTINDYIISLIVIAMLPAVFEEMLFRGALQPILIGLTKNAFAGILVTSILFSAIHESFYGFLPRLALGLIIGYVFYYSKNLWLSSLTHFLYNALGVTQMYSLSKQGMLTANALNENTFSPVYGLVAAIALFIIFIFFKRESEVVISMYNLGRKNPG